MATLTLDEQIRKHRPEAILDTSGMSGKVTGSRRRTSRLVRCRLAPLQESRAIAKASLPAFAVFLIRLDSLSSSQ